MKPPPVTRVEVPAGSLVARSLAKIDYADAYAIELPEAREIDAVVDAALGAFPRWIKRLMAARDAVVRPLGLKTTGSYDRPRGVRYAIGDAFAIFRVIDRDDHELLFGEDDRHLDFRVGFQVDGEKLTLSTLVQFHNALGRAYFLPVAPAHRRIVPAILRATWRATFR